MTCDHVREQLTAYHLGDLDDATAAAVRTHLGACRDCQVALQQIASTLDVLRDALGESAKALPQGLSESSRQRVLDRAGQPMAADGEPPSWKQWIFTGHPRLAYAAGVALIVGMVWLILPHAHGPSEPVQAVSREMIQERVAPQEAKKLDAISAIETTPSAPVASAALPQSAAVMNGVREVRKQVSVGETMGGAVGGEREDRAAAPVARSKRAPAVAPAPAPAPKVAAEAEHDFSSPAQRLEGFMDAASSGDDNQRLRANYSPPPALAEVVQEEPPRPEVLQRLDDIHIAEVDFRQAHIHDVAKYLEDLTRETGAGKKDQPAITIKLDPAFQAIPSSSIGKLKDADDGLASGEVAELVTFRAREISALEVLKISTDVVNMKYRVAGNEILIVPYNAPDGPILRRSYRLLPETAQAIIRSGLAGGDQRDNADSQSEGEALMGFFGEMGVLWPLGSTVTYDGISGQLVVESDARTLQILDLQFEVGKGASRQGAPQQEPP